MGSDHVELKSLEVRRSEANRRLSALQQELSALQKKVQAEQRDISAIDREIDRLKTKKEAGELIVSEHAILRFLERVWKIDIEDVKQDIAPPTIQQAVKALGNGEYPVGDTHKIRVRDNVVITITTKDGAP